MCETVSEYGVTEGIAISRGSALSVLGNDARGITHDGSSLAKLGRLGLLLAARAFSSNKLGGKGF